MKFSQKIFAEMQRFKDPAGKWILDEKGNCYMVRNKTKIAFDESDRLLGTVVMTNPGSFKLKEHPEWKAFSKGCGTKATLTGEGKPDPTFRIIIDVINQGYARAFGEHPKGYVNVHNISSVVCSKKRRMQFNHNVVEQAIQQQQLNMDVLKCDQLKTFNNLEIIAEQSPFVIMGFVKDVFEGKAMELMHCSDQFDNIVFVKDNSGWWAHPFRWGPFPEFKEAAIHKLVRVLQSNYLAKAD